LIDDNKGRKRFVSGLNKLKICYDVEKGDYSSAISILEKSGFILKHLKQKLSMLIAEEIIHSGNAKDKDLVSWANKAFSTYRK
jgi:hypothetical protein